jgi:hypothetical protein
MMLEVAYHSLSGILGTIEIKIILVNEVNKYNVLNSASTYSTSAYHIENTVPLLALS